MWTFSFNNISKAPKFNLRCWKVIFMGFNFWEKSGSKSLIFPCTLRSTKEDLVKPFPPGTNFYHVFCIPISHLSLTRRFVRNQIIFANTMFKAVCYRPDECQVITAGTDKNVRYFFPCISGKLYLYSYFCTIALKRLHWVAAFLGTLLRVHDY